MEPPADDDILRARAGEGAALARLYDFIRPLAYRVAAGILGDAHRAEDAAHDVYLQAVRALDRFRPGTSFPAWVRRIAVNHSLNLAKREGRRPSIESQAAASDPAGGSADVLDTLRRIPDDFRVCLVLKDVEGATYEEIASALGIPLGTAISRVHRARARLRELLESAEKPRPPDC